MDDMRPTEAGLDNRTILAAILDLGQRIDARMQLVGAKLSDLRQQVGQFDERMRKVEENVARVDGRVSQMPTAWQFLVGVVAIIGVTIVGVTL